MLSVPPKMSAAQMFWWGVGLIALHLLAEWLVRRLVMEQTYPMFLLNFPSVVSLFVTVAGQLGVGLVAGSVVVRALRAPSQSQRETALEERP